jgi:hypothetical protein
MFQVIALSVLFLQVCVRAIPETMLLPLNCARPLAVGDVYMGITATPNKETIITVKRKKEVLLSGANYEPGEQLEVTFTAPAKERALLNLMGEGAVFSKNSNFPTYLAIGCGNCRVATTTEAVDITVNLEISKLASGTIKINVARSAGPLITDPYFKVGEYFELRPPTPEECTGPFGKRGDKYAQCEKRIQVILKTKDCAWFAERGMDGGRCSIQQYLSEQPDNACPPVVSPSPSAAPTKDAYYSDSSPEFSKDEFFSE